MCQTDFLKPGNAAFRQTGQQLGSLVNQPCQQGKSGVLQTSVGHGCLFLLLTVKWTWVWQPRAQWVAPGSRSQVTMALNRLSPAARSISVSAQTCCAVRQILAAALLLREVIWVGCLLAFSLKCHLWGVIFYLAKYSNKKSHGRTSQGSILCSLA